MQSHKDYSSYFEITKYLRDNNNDYNMLSEEQILKLYQLAEHDRNYTSAYARNILSLVDTNFVYHEPIYLPDENNKLKMSKPIKLSTKEINQLKVFPNPAKEFFIVDYQISDIMKNTQLELIDAAGRKVQIIELKTTKGQTMIKTENMAKGLYHCYLYNNNAIVMHTKITIE